MKLLKIIYEADLGLSDDKELNIGYKVRQAARAVIFNDQKQIAILEVTNRQHCKLPGGGVEAGENIYQALEREVMEETGCEVEIISELGQTIEYRNQVAIKQESFCFVCKLKRIVSEPSFTDKEIKDGFVLKWQDLDAAITAVKQAQPTDYFGHFIQYRDAIFLDEYKNNL